VDDAPVRDSPRTAFCCPHLLDTPSSQHPFHSTPSSLLPRRPPHFSLDVPLNQTPILLTSSITDSLFGPPPSILNIHHRITLHIIAKTYKAGLNAMTGAGIPTSMAEAAFLYTSQYCTNSCATEVSEESVTIERCMLL
jgi:hypothetical protein